eukprot:jgi/Chrzof1/7880/Cz02g39250.t1
MINDTKVLPQHDNNTTATHALGCSSAMGCLWPPYVAYAAAAAAGDGGGGCCCCYCYLGDEKLLPGGGWSVKSNNTHATAIHMSPDTTADAMNEKGCDDKQCKM